MSGSLLVAGASSDAGKSLVTAGICRWLRDQGVDVAPFKAQNMSNNSAVTADGGEIGRAQAMQARACRLEPSTDMNPVLLKPGGDRAAHVVLRGRAYADSDAVDYRRLKTELRGAVLDSYDRLRARHEVVICEGAGSPAEINLRDSDIANMWLADQRELPTLVVGDIDRGGVFAALFGTLAVLDARDQSLVAGFVINKFRGDPRLVSPGVDALSRLTGRQVLGVLPWLPEAGLDTEDSLSLAGVRSGGAPLGPETLQVAVIRLPRTANSTDVDALGAEPGVVVRWTTSAVHVADADLVVLPGTRATVHDLEWLRRVGLADVVRARARAGKPVLGICGGHQMLARTIVDDVESRAGRVPGLDLLPIEVVFAAEKTVGRVHGTACGAPVHTGYEIHHGLCRPAAERPDTQQFLDGQQHDAVWGTSWHGIFDSDEFRRAFLIEVAAAAGRAFVPAPDTEIAALRERQLDVVAGAVATHLDTDALLRLLADGVPTGLPTLTSMLSTGARA